MKRKKFFLWITFITPMVICASIYLALAVYYKNGFSFGTWINGVYCTGKTVETINQELCTTKKSKSIRIIEKSGKVNVLPYDAIEYREDFTTPLNKVKEHQRPLLWGINLWERKSQVLLPVISYNKQLLKSNLMQLDFMKHTLDVEKPKVEIIESPEGYALYDNTDSFINAERVLNTVADAISEQKTEVNLSDEKCYESINKTKSMESTCEMWEKVKEFQNFNVRYLFGDTIEVLDSSVVADWILMDEDGQFCLDDSGNLMLNENMIKEYIASLASEYDTVGGTRQFQTTRGEVVTVKGGTYGNQLDQKAEFEYLKNAFIQHNEADRTPAYKVTAKKQGVNDIGDTYIEIDMKNQMLYYYENKELIIETPVVTGNTALGRGTPERVCYVYAKQKNRILRGPNYAAHVNFWMPVNGGIGIHDSAWRKTYGGEIYKTNGSHGCINTPYDAMTQLYDKAEIGTPVIMFY